jgi:hypothetical protein
VRKRRGLGSLATIVVAGPLDDLARARARDMKLDLAPVSLQDFVISSSNDMRERMPA